MVVTDSREFVMLKLYDPFDASNNNRTQKIREGWSKAGTEQKCRR